MRISKLIATGAAVAVLASAGMAQAADGDTLKLVRDRGVLNCGVSNGLAGFAAPNERNEWVGFDVDVCRAVAAAVFGDASKVAFTPTTSKERFTVLQSGEIDMLSRNSTWTATRDNQLGLDFVAVNYYDGQGFMVRKDLGVKSALELDGASVCIQTGTTTELNLADYFRANNMKFTSVVVETNDQARAAYDAGRCDVYTTDASGLAAERTLLSTPADHIILPQIISKEPLGPSVRHGDNNWGDIVRWAFNMMVAAEEKGITSANVDQVKASTTDPEVKRMLGDEGDLGTQLGLSQSFGYNVIKLVGNYGESFERHLGVNTALGLERGLNAQWSKGGILYAPPFR